MPFVFLFTFFFAKGSISLGNSIMNGMPLCNTTCLRKMLRASDKDRPSPSNMGVTSSRSLESMRIVFAMVFIASNICYINTKCNRIIAKSCVIMSKVIKKLNRGFLTFHISHSTLLDPSLRYAPFRMTQKAIPHFTLLTPHSSLLTPNP